MDEKTLDLVASVLALILAIPWYPIGIYYWRNPGKLSRSSWLYRRWLLRWQAGLRKSAKTTTELNERKIKGFALSTLFAGIGLTVVGIYGLVTYFR